MWDTIDLETADNAFFWDIIHVLQSKYLYVCLVNTGNGITFISALELRLLDNTTYTTESPTESLSTDTFKKIRCWFDVRLKDDAYDRIWWPYERNDWTQINTSEDGGNNRYQPPWVVMNTAGTPRNATQPMNIFIEFETDTRF
ncbi:hypothetical protein REPUB_Repub14bG0058400 [Reevesia pubescens]